MKMLQFIRQASALPFYLIAHLFCRLANLISGNDIMVGGKYDGE